MEDDELELDTIGDKKTALFLIKTYTDENRNLYISVLRTVIKEELSDGETEIMNYGFNHEKKDYIAVYYGTPNNCELIWKKGDLLPTAPKDIFE